MKGIEACALKCLTNEVGLSLMLLGALSTRSKGVEPWFFSYISTNICIQCYLVGDVRSILWSTRLKGWKKTGIILFFSYIWVNICIQFSQQNIDEKY
jgi:hypothetical protein